MRRAFLLPVLLLLVLSACAKAAEPTLPPAPPIGEPQISETEVPRLSLEEAKAAFDGKTAVFVDVRGAGSYAASHIPGALSIPLNELEGRLGELDPSQWIITYCT
ncbi:MAG TPA: rhodanese-like domain-containing protein [Anaerolineales bacterium]